ncbi:MAG: hypothetical protein DCC66_06630 [Planctomycetota bacterium]|nr:MAG: hypothetical protein DCC66_06630 [Planctomycetota bacterium]
MTSLATNAACACAPILPVGFIRCAGRVIARAGPHVPKLGRLVRGNLIAAGIDRPDAVAAYFDQVGLHLACSAMVFKHQRRPERIMELAARHIVLDPSTAIIGEALAAGRGVIVAAAHTCNFLLTLARLNQQTPISVYLRWTADARRLRLKRIWCDAARLPLIIEQPMATDPTSRAAACVEALQRGAALVMTPDIAQKSDKGVPVELFDRRMYLPSGPASIAMLAEAPLIPLFGRIVNGRQVLYAETPIEVRARSRVEGGRKAGLAAAMRQWAAGFERFLRASPDAWFLWGDSRWTRVFQFTDERYVTRLEETDAAYRGAVPGSATRGMVR